MMIDHAATTASVSDLMTRDPIVIRADAPLADAALLLEANHVHGLPVVDETGLLVGVVSQTDMLRARTTEHLWAAWRGLKVRHLMSSPALTVSSDESLTTAAARMEENQIHRLVVLASDGVSPIGILSTTDIVRAMLEERGDERA
jgi:CBS domain-containing protein